MFVPKAHRTCCRRTLRRHSQKLASLHLCIVTPNCITMLLVIIAICGATIQRCSGAWLWLIIILAVVSCTGLFPCFLHLFSNNYPTCFCTSYTCSTLYLLKFLFLYGLVFLIWLQKTAKIPLCQCYKLQRQNCNVGRRGLIWHPPMPLCCDLHSISCYCSLCAQTAACMAALVLLLYLACLHLQIFTLWYTSIHSRQ